MRTKMRPECIKLRELLRNPNDELEAYVSIEQICEAMSTRLNYEVHTRTIKNCLTMWNRRFNKLYLKMKKNEMLKGTPDENWNIVMTSFERLYGIEPMFFQKTNGVKGITGTYINPSFREKEDISKANLVHKIRGVGTQLKSMEVYGETFRLTGKKPLELLRDAKRMEIKVLNGEVNENKYKVED